MLYIYTTITEVAASTATAGARGLRVCPNGKRESSGLTREVVQG